MEDASRALHIVVFPWLAFGHLHPCLELAGRLASRGHRVSFLSTPRNIARLRHRPAASHVEFVELPLPRVHGLPDGAEATSDVPAENSAALWEASDGLAAPFSAFLDKQVVVDWVIFDSLHHWAPAAAADRNVPCVLIIPYSAAACAHFGVPTTAVAASDDKFPSAIARRFVSALEGCRLIVVRSCVEFEPESVPLLSRIFGKPAFPIGLLPPQINNKSGGDKTCTSWLDARPRSSVVYVALGSEAPLSAEQYRELALGLELSGAPFLWALRKPDYHDGDAADDVTLQLLPPGFEDRTRGRGMVRTGWVPQLEILGHEAVGAFLTHCGYSSVIEGLRFGHPLVMLPLFIDQFPLASYLQGVKKVGVQVPRAQDGTTFDRDGAAGAIRAAVVDQERNKVFAGNAKKLQGLVADRECHERCIDAFVQQLRSYKDQ
uniref:Glycosyltransferase n=1 Tax=Leersia perrieri TaxID=77586 RepID=A0A0D9VGU5_9ORYZ